MDYEKEKLFEERYPFLYSLLAAFSYGVEEGKSDWDIVREEVRECETAERILSEVDEFLKSNPAQFEHVVGDVANYYFDDTNDFLRWMEEVKRYLISVKRQLCGGN
ncbi:MAG: hypothetical protein DSZ25_01030 [Thermovibrio sp.]|nr:MAG: hypothetical protein DSZ25_01030 [Thermovibrio sp.]